MNQNTINSKEVKLKNLNNYLSTLPNVGYEIKQDTKINGKHFSIGLTAWCKVCNGNKKETKTCEHLSGIHENVSHILKNKS